MTQATEKQVAVAVLKILAGTPGREASLDVLKGELPKHFPNDSRHGAISFRKSDPTDSVPAFSRTIAWSLHRTVDGRLRQTANDSSKLRSDPEARRIGRRCAKMRAVRA